MEDNLILHFDINKLIDWLIDPDQTVHESCQW